LPNTSINIRTDIEIKKQAEAILAEIGLNMTTLVNMLLRQVIEKRGVPFALTIDSPIRTLSDGEIMEERAACLKRITEAISSSMDEELVTTKYYLGMFLNM